MSAPPDVVQIPGYTIIRPLGIGGMASVYLALQESLDREVALKVMAPALAANQEFTGRFLKEGRITAKLSHPNLVTVFDIGQHGTTYYLAAEYIPGGTLRERMSAGMSIGEMLDVIRDVAAGLHYAHEKGFVHRDVKPGNILFKTNGTAVLADFGIAKSMGQDASSRTMATQVGNSIGTPHYMSPEQARAEKVDGRSDLYALGAVLYEMLTNEPPYDASDPFTIALMHVTHPLPKLPAQVAWLQPLIDRLMAKSADDRYPTGEAFIADLEKLLATAPEAAALRSGQDTRKRAAPRLSGNYSAAPAAAPKAVPAAAASPAATADSRPRQPASKGMLVALVVMGLVTVALGSWIAFRPGAEPAGIPVTTVPAVPPVQPTLTQPTDTQPTGT
ncbi:MAG TPA: serine/threonine-protein kinase, partial [Xanthomonadales bacterium]|nr:serine/threonine-protein kinase [Xanthomonadales bacterium]